VVFLTSAKSIAFGQQFVFSDVLGIIEVLMLWRVPSWRDHHHVRGRHFTSAL
jgi:hypothetical protein